MSTWRGVFVHSGAGGHEGELGLCENSLQFFCILCLNAFECINWQELKTRAIDKL